MDGWGKTVVRVGRVGVGRGVGSCSVGRVGRGDVGVGGGGVGRGRSVVGRGGRIVGRGGSVAIIVVGWCKRVLGRSKWDGPSDSRRHRTLLHVGMATGREISDRVVTTLTTFTIVTTMTMAALLVPHLGGFAFRHGEFRYDEGK